MAVAPSSSPRLEGDELDALLELAGAADSVELKLTVADAEQRSTIEALGMDPIDAQIRQVFFFDTPDLALDRAGVVVRARRIQGAKPDDAVVKLRPVVPAELPKGLRRTAGFGVEVDVVPGGFVCSASLKHTVRVGHVKEAVAGQRPLRKVFSKEQRAFFADHAPAGTTLDDLVVLGPIFVLKLKFSPGDFHRKLVAEFWLYPDEGRILELSTKCLPVEAVAVAAESRDFLTRQGVDLSGEQQTKTRRALEFFGERLQRQA